MSKEVTIPYELRGGPDDGEIAWLPLRTRWYVSFGGYRHAIYVSTNPDVKVLHFKGTAATCEEAEERADADTR